MNLIKAENRELDALDINQPKESPPDLRKDPARGYYLALTFGTLLSSQGADAQKLDPRGLRVWRICPTLRRFPDAPRSGGSGPAALPGRAAQGEHYTTFQGVCRGVPTGPCHVGVDAQKARKSGLAGHTAGPELDADPRPHGLRRLRDAVLPRALAGAAHDDQVAVPERKPDAGSAADGAEQQRPRGTEGHDRDHRVGRPSAADPVAVPGHAVASVAVETHSCGDEALAELRPVVPVEVGARIGEQGVWQRLVTPVP